MKIRLFENTDGKPYAYECMAGVWYLSVTFAGGGSRHIGWYDRADNHHTVKSRMVVFMEKSVSEQFVHDALFNMNPVGKHTDNVSYPISRFPKDGYEAVAVLASENAHGSISKDTLVIENFSKWRTEREFMLLGEVKDFDWNRDVTYVNGVMHVSRPSEATK